MRLPPGAALVAVGCLSAAGVIGCKKDTPPGSATPLHCYVGGTMRPVMEKLAADYEKQTGQKVVIDSAGSGELLIRIDTQRKGDLYVCHDPFGRVLMEKGLGTQIRTVAVVTPTIVVAKGNPKRIQSVKDLARGGLKLAMTHPTNSTTGWIIPVIFRKAGAQKAIEANIVKRTRGGGAAANLVAIGDVDAAIVWNAVAYLRRDKLDTVPIDEPFRPIPGVDAITSPTEKVYEIATIKVTLATLDCSKQPEAANRFADFVAANTNVFTEQFGFTAPPPGAAKATLHVHCGAGLRPAMEQAARAFEQNTGATVQASYQGSGVLISTLKLKPEGDLYIPGDVWYLDQLAADGSVVARKPIALLEPVIIVAKGNPKAIQSLADLARPGIRLGVGNPKACQIGRLTGQIFAKSRIDPAAVQKNTVYSPGTVNELGLKVQLGGIDAAIVWDAVAAAFAKDVDVVKIPPADNIVSRVAAGVLKYSTNRPLAERFATFLAAAEGRAIFEKHGYTVQEPATAPN